MAVVTSIREDPKGSKRRALFLDGEPWRKTSIEVLRAAGVSQGDERSPEALEALISAKEPSAAHERALRLLEFRDRSKRELRDKLVADGYPQAVADAVVQRMAELGLVDDERFAEVLARSLKSRGMGRSRAGREMRLKGVPDGVLQSALDEAFPAGDEEERATAVALSLVRKSGGDARRLAAALARRGFAPPIAFHVARKVLEDVQEERSGD